MYLNIACDDLSLEKLRQAPYIQSKMSSVAWRRRRSLQVMESHGPGLIVETESTAKITIFHLLMSILGTTPVFNDITPPSPLAAYI